MRKFLFSVISITSITISFNNHLHECDNHNHAKPELHHRHMNIYWEVQLYSSKFCWPTTTLKLDQGHHGWYENSAQWV